MEHPWLLRSHFKDLFLHIIHWKENNSVCTLSKRNGNQANTSLKSCHNAKWCKANAVLSPLGRLTSSHDWRIMRTHWMKTRCFCLQYYNNPFSFFLIQTHGQNLQIYRSLFATTSHSGRNLKGRQLREHFLEESTYNLRFCVRGRRVHEKQTFEKQF